MKTATTGTMLRRAATLASAAALVLCGAGGLAGCGALDVSDPTAIEDQELNDAAGARLLRGAALKKLSEAVDDGAYWSGLLADEFLYDLPSWAQPGTLADELLDRRQSVQYETALGLGDARSYGLWQEVRRAAAVALPKARAYASAASAGEMLAVRAFATLRLAEDFCPGFPLHDVVDLKTIFSPPLSTEAALAKALADFDSAVTSAADSARILNFAQVGRARTLLGVGRIEEAGAAVADVPTSFIHQAEYHGASFLSNSLSLEFFGSFFLGRSIADQEGGTGLAFVSSGDPRVESEPVGTAVDGVTGLYGIAKYPNADAPIVLASGIEARLIEAEAALQSGGDWLGILNALRTTCTDVGTCPDPAPAGSGGVAGLPPLTDPGTETAQLDLVFRERALWLFATGHRLADLRRLVRVYGRAAESVFPTGAYRTGGVYGTATSIPFPAIQETTFNPAVTGCTSR